MAPSTLRLEVGAIAEYIRNGAALQAPVTLDVYQCTLVPSEVFKKRPKSEFFVTGPVDNFGCPNRIIGP
jgi:hypothetical protein